MGLSRTVSKINSDFSRKSQNFPTPVYFALRRRGSPWKWIPALGVKKLEWWGYWAEKEVWQYLQPSGYNAPMLQTNGRTYKETDGHRATAKTVLTHRVGG